MDINSLSSGGYISATSLDSLLVQTLSPFTQQIAALNQQSASDTTQISEFGQVQSALSSLQDAAQKLIGPSAFSAYSASSSSPTVLTASADATATSGTNTLQVNQLAQAQALTSAGQSSSTSAIGSGTSTTVTFQLGTASNGTFTPSATQAAQSVTIDASNNSLSGIASSINSAGLGVNAAVTYDGTNYHLALTSAQTGAANAFTVSVSGDAALQNLLSYSPGATQSNALTQAAQDANLAVNGVSINSANNTVSGALQGVTFNLTGVGSSTVTVAPNGSLLADNVANFVNAYNNTITTINKLQASDLAADPTLQGIQSSLSGLLNTPSDGTFAGLAQVGVTTQADGTLAFDRNAFQSALTSNAADVAKLFTSSVAGTGVADQALAVAQSYGDTGGIISTQIAQLALGVQDAQSQSVGASSALDAMTSSLRGQFADLYALQNSIQYSDQLLVSQIGPAAGGALPSIPSDPISQLNQLSNLMTP